jgi:hypothetical protein
MTTLDRRSDRADWRAALPVLVLGFLAALLGAAPASAAPVTPTYDMAAYVYDAPAELSSPDAVASYVRDLRAGPEVASWGRSASTRGCCVAAEAEGTSVQLFRHAGPEELADLKSTGQFNLGSNSTGKYFAENTGDAAKWGEWLNGGQGGVVSTRVPQSFADQMMQWEKLDGIGPARFASPEQLDTLNRVMSGIEFH